MKNLLQIVFVSVVFFLTVGLNISKGQLPFPVLGPVTNSANGHQYYILSPATWNDAETAAVGLGGHLVAINDQNENDFIMFNFSWTYGNLWIGFTDRSVEGNWVWVNGEPVTYTFWSGGEPNNSGGENYAEFYTYGSWNDLSGSQELYSVVEVAPQPSPSPTVPTLSQWGLILLGIFLLGAGSFYIIKRRRVISQL